MDSQPTQDNFKVCKECNQWLPIEAFSTHKRNKDGLHHYCNDCKNEFHSRKRIVYFTSSEIVFDGPEFWATLPFDKDGNVVNE